MIKNIFNKAKNQLQQDTKQIKEYKIKETNPETKVLTFNPSTEDDIQQIADAIMKKNIVHVSFNKFSENDKRNFKSFINGVKYATQATMQKVGDDQFIFSPKE